MKLLVISDSHGLSDELFKRIDHFSTEVDLIIHCGDSELPRKSFKDFENLIIVGGNCDFDGMYAEETRYDLKGLSLFVTHGHLYDVKTSAVKLSYRAEELGVQLVFFGHTHKAVSFQENGIVYVNPGSFRLPKYRPERSYAIVDINEAVVTVGFYDHEGNELMDLKKTYDLV